MKAMRPDDRQRIKLEVTKEIDAYFLRKCLDIDSIVLWILHVKFGFGKKRLRRFFDGYIKEVKIMQEQYGEYAPDRMRKVLKQIGVDLEEWEKEIA